METPVFDRIYENLNLGLEFFALTMNPSYDAMEFKHQYVTAQHYPEYIGNYQIILKKGFAIIDDLIRANKQLSRELDILYIKDNDQYYLLTEMLDRRLSDIMRDSLFQYIEYDFVDSNNPKRGKYFEMKERQFNVYEDGVTCDIYNRTYMLAQQLVSVSTEGMSGKELVSFPQMKMLFAYVIHGVYRYLNRARYVLEFKEAPAKDVEDDYDILNLEKSNLPQRLAAFDALGIIEFLKSNHEALIHSPKNVATALALLMGVEQSEMKTFYATVKNLLNNSDKSPVNEKNKTKNNIEFLKAGIDLSRKNKLGKK